MSIEEVVGLANKYIAEGSSVELHATIFHSLVLRVFRGSQYLGGYWENVAKTENDKFFGTIKSRKYAELKRVEFVDYTKICNMRD